MNASDNLPVLVTYDWVPQFPRGFVRELRIRWAFEELGQPYRVETVPFAPRSDAHLAMQPFGQVPILKTPTRTLFESGAILLHLAGEESALMPKGRRDEVTQWLFAAFNTVELSTFPWVLMKAAQQAPEIFGAAPPDDQIAKASTRMRARLDGLSRVLGDREWLVGDFSAADIAMADVLRVAAADGGIDGHPALASYVERASTRPAFLKAFADHMDHWTMSDLARAKRSA